MLNMFQHTPNEFDSNAQHLCLRRTSLPSLPGRWQSTTSSPRSSLCVCERRERRRSRVGGIEWDWAKCTGRCSTVYEWEASWENVIILMLWESREWRIGKRVMACFVDSMICSFVRTWASTRICACSYLLTPDACVRGSERAMDPRANVAAPVPRSDSQQKHW